MLQTKTIKYKYEAAAPITEIDNSDVDPCLIKIEVPTHYDQGHITFCWLSENNRILYNGITGCKDYFNDNVWDAFKGGGKIPKYLRLLIVIPNKHQNIEINILVSLIKDFLNQIEQDLAIPLSQEFLIKNTTKDTSQNQYFILVGSNEWLRALPMLALYLNLIRVSPAHQAGTNYQETLKKVISGDLPVDKSCDKEYSAALLRMINLFKKYNYKTFFRNPIEDNYTKEEMPVNGLSTTSHGGGIVALHNLLFKPNFKIASYYYNAAVDSYQFRPELMKRLVEGDGKMIRKSIEVSICEKGTFEYKQKVIDLLEGS